MFLLCLMRFGRIILSHPTPFPSSLLLKIHEITTVVEVLMWNANGQVTESPGGQMLA